MINIFLDDLRPCPDNYIPARSYNEMIRLLTENKGNIANISLDHDLGEIRSGYDVCKWMVENEVYPTNSITIHSSNPSGVQAMLQLLTRYAPESCDVADKYGNRYYR